MKQLSKFAGIVVVIASLASAALAQQSRISNQGGNWSQDSSVLVVPRGDEIETHWPGGKRTRTKIDPTSTEVTVDFSAMGQ